MSGESFSIIVVAGRAHSFVLLDTSYVSVWLLVMGFNPTWYLSRVPLSAADGERGAISGGDSGKECSARASVDGSFRSNLPHGVNTPWHPIYYRRILPFINMKNMEKDKQMKNGDNK